MKGETMTNSETIPDSIMQAVERLRRVNAGEDPADNCDGF
jgi:hypothetical protein